VSVPGLRFNAPPGWPPPPPGWSPPEGWLPDPAWPGAPAGWQFWIPDPIQPADQPAEASVSPAPGPPAGHPGDLVAPTPAGPAKGAELELAAQADARAAGDSTAGATPPIAPDPSVAATDSVRADEELLALRAERDALRVQLRQMSETHAASAGTESESDLLADVGIYQYRHPLDTAAQYKDALREIQEQIREHITGRHAIEASDRFVYNNSLAQGRRMVADFSKLMLRAYNAEAENCVRTVRAGSVTAAVQRLDRAVTAIARLGTFMEMRVSADYHDLRVREIELTGDFLIKVQEEREAERAAREELREQRKAAAELQAEHDRLEKEREHYQNALNAIQTHGGDAQQVLERLSQIDEALTQNDYRIANIRAGYVYVISNLGAFGPDVVKIGMTRRLDPMDRVRELGDASVPFPFDVHMIHFSNDAVGVESRLHQAFSEARINQVNLRREFFRATPRQVREILVAQVGNVLEFTDEPEAAQYRQSQAHHDVT